ncbi:protein SODIUM POTASSIUM ROOT DEFECTIVE 3-like [Impatiens glandulifera]|uniref:protein SODIUM POTASSIUM ROOT DEFECTIVE 3-like n=1 Tax=Impatiens glandulifera TaxID=253017 RepID=UPI001FB117C1|nr:protein SODIUM POTASSIUM ROOT DEFECTIVE 3-like [Impatiens glandulifera]
MDEISIPSSSTCGGRTIDRHNPIIHDRRRIGKLSPPYNNQLIQNHDDDDEDNDDDDKEEQGRKNSLKLVDYERNNNKALPTSSCSSSSRYLLDDDSSSLSDTILGHFQDPVPTKKKITFTDKVVIKSDNFSTSIFSPLSSSSSSFPPPTSTPDNQVVVIRVSLHCRGCEAKVRKHISRMKGVTSFKIEFTEKKVTVVGDVTPLSVLATISKVKNAQIISLPPPTSGPILLNEFQS